MLVVVLDALALVRLRRTLVAHIGGKLADLLLIDALDDDVNIRGFIEGYYGLPWSNEDRMSLMRFGGDYKMTSYIFAPKDDDFFAPVDIILNPGETIKIPTYSFIGRQTEIIKRNNQLLIIFGYKRICPSILSSIT